MRGRPVVAPVMTVVARAATMRGHVDVASRLRITGWAAGADPNEPVGLQVLDNGRPIARVLANLYRPDLEAGGVGAGRHGFDLIVPGGLSALTRHVIQVRREADGSELVGSPAVIEASDAFDAGLEHAVALAVAAVGDETTRQRVLAFLAAQTDALLQQYADAACGAVARETHQLHVRRAGPSAAALPSPQKRALVIDEQVPDAGRDAGSEAMLSHVRALQGLGYAVSLVAADALDGGPAGNGAALQALEVSLCGAPFYASVEEVLRRQAHSFDVVYLHRASIAARYLTLVRRHQAQARVLYSVADLHHVRLERQAAAEDRPELLSSSRAMRLLECTAAWQADAVLTHSLDEAAMLRRMVPEARVHRVLWDVPVQPGVTGFARRRGVAFIGHYAHEPNRDAVRWLLQGIMPLVWAVDPALPLLLVGDALPDSLRTMAAGAGGPVEVLGRVGDLSALLERTRLTVAPLRFGAGVKGKVLDSLAAGVPCVVTPIAAEGIGWPEALAGLLASDEAGLAAAVVQLHGDGAAWAAAGSAGAAFVRSACGIEQVQAALLAAIEGRRAMEGGAEVSVMQTPSSA